MLNRVDKYRQKIRTRIYQINPKKLVLKNKSKWIQYVENPQINRILINSFVLPISFFREDDKEIGFKTLKERRIYPC